MIKDEINSIDAIVGIPLLVLQFVFFDLYVCNWIYEDFEFFFNYDQISLN